MNKFFKVFTVFLLFITIAGSILAYNTAKNRHEKYFFDGRKNIECLYYDPSDFINIPEYETSQDIGTIHGCIVPHHLVAKDLIHEVFQKCKKINIKQWY